ncbi:Na+/H+ antiporter NhaC family protein [Marinicella litoralis]|uniref:Transporter (NhaC family) n=1 Tax=Marinicella litoralis TaxID=644220 RepID=A0A4R6XAT3_9GAMM|nr:Na+/H+ antiporter NhaC family protein [Marinicella litoralis]TDR16315.1 transporter (NhaC family) [Marinicella litoralis]
MKIKQTHFSHALLVFAGLFGLIAVGMFALGQMLHMALLVSVIWVALNAWLLGFQYETIREMMSSAINRALPAFYIFLLIGLVIAALMKSGTVATLIYYGLDWLSPQLFLPVGFVLCAMMSLLTGTSWGTVGTLGVVFIGIGTAMELPMHWVAGMVISGATFGDKMSPISDTTNLAAMSAETDLYAHIRSMLMTTVPTFILVLVIFAVVGLNFAAVDGSDSQVESIQMALANTFNLNPLLTLWPVVVMAVLSYKKFAPEISMTACVLTAALIALFIQGESVTGLTHALFSNSKADTGIASIDDLLGRGGLYSMAWTLLLAIIAIALGGILQGAGFVHALLGGLVKRVKSTGSLIATTIGTGFLTAAALSEAYIAILLNSELYKKTFKDRGIDASVLSRSVEEGVTLLVAVIPWSVAGAFYSATLGISVIEYAPFALFNLLNPIIAIVLAYLGVAIIKSKSQQS